MSEAERQIGRLNRPDYSAAFFHIEKFRYLNELFGYENGTKVLEGIAGALRRGLGKGEIVSHWFADRYALFLTDSDPETLEKRAERILSDLKDSVQFYGIHYTMVPAFGICTQRKKDSLQVEEMVNRAVIAAKFCQEDAPVSFFQESMVSSSLLDKNKEDRFSSALEKKQFQVYYQPKYRARDGALAGAEALVRWQADKKTLVPPSEFIPLFERDGRIARLDFYVFSRVCRDLRNWLQKKMRVVPVSVNLSRAALREPGLARRYRETAGHFRIPGSLLELEITESAFADRRGARPELWEELHRAGFSLAVDDFGTGCSSLCLLGSVRAETLKLDREFLLHLAAGERGKAVLKSVVALSRALHMETVAEGVETREQYRFLRSIRCSLIQGYLFSGPLPAARFEKLLAGQPAEKDPQPCRSRLFP